MGCYRSTDFADPEVFAASVVSVLARWPADVITSVTEPATGLPSRCKWPPSIAEITEACEQSYQPRRAQAAIERTTKMLAAPAPVRPTPEQLDAQFERLGLSHLRPGSKFHVRARVSDDQRRSAQATLDRYADEARRSQPPHSEAAE